MSKTARQNESDDTNQATLQGGFRPDSGREDCLAGLLSALHPDTDFETIYELAKERGYIE